mmetsp:Transcript_23043/g.50694  ORF Transcript_23043/g.50694 Transcript_23043/m.50694 type:complete len:515 (+) Transcript_23043:38-1582(+)
MKISLLATALLAVEAAKKSQTKAEKKAAKKARWSQNCASQGLCNVPIEFRDPSVNAAPPGSPTGHMKPLGHPDTLGFWGGEVETLYGDVEPAEFWSKFWPRKPFLLKGFAKDSDAVKKWDDEYLVENYGDLKAKTEPKNEDRLTDYCSQKKFGEKVVCDKKIKPYAESYMKVKDFLRSYRNESFEKYIITQMPDVMGKEWPVPNFFNCAKRPEADRKHQKAPYMTRMYENNLWINMNHGHSFSSSVIHYDMNHQIMCQISGKKEWFFWDMKEDGHNIPTWSKYYNQKRHTASSSDDSPIDAERIDLEKFPQFASAKWYNTTMEPGDCLFTPALSMHYVRTTGRAIALMTMFQTEERPDPECIKKHTLSAMQNHTMDEYDTAWSFPEEREGLLGWNMVKMGFPNWRLGMQDPLFRHINKQKGKSIDEKQLMKFLKPQLDKWSKSMKQRVSQAFKVATTEGKKKGITPEMVYSSQALRYLFKDIAVMSEGGPVGQAEGKTYADYGAGNQKEFKVEL